MSDFKGTPGPWSFEHNSASDDEIFCINVVAHDSTDICYLQSHEKYLPNRVHTVANVNLIAAAPELLEALQHIMRMQTFGYIVLGEEATGKAKSAITNALGQ